VELSVIKETAPQGPYCQKKKKKPAAPSRMVLSRARPAARHLCLEVQWAGKKAGKTIGKQKKEGLHKERESREAKRVTDEPTHCPIRGLLSKWKREVEESS
jgi:hypothetical protein